MPITIDRNYISDQEILSKIYSWECKIVEKEYFEHLQECAKKIQEIEKIMKIKQYYNSITTNQN